MAAVGNIVDAMEAWLAGAEFEEAWQECYDRVCRGSGRSDRNISETVLFQTAAAVHHHLPAGDLEDMIPEPDMEFIRGALEHIGAQDHKREGFKDLEQFEAALVVVYTQLAMCAEILRQRMPSIAAAIEMGLPPA